MEILQNPPEFIVSGMWKWANLEPKRTRRLPTKRDVENAIVEYLMGLYYDTIYDPIVFEDGISEGVYIEDCGGSYVLRDIIVDDRWAVLHQSFESNRILDILIKNLKNPGG